MSNSTTTPRIGAILPEEATGATLVSLYKRAEEHMGMIPNLFHHLALSPKVLQGFLELQIALEEGYLSVENRESIALRVAEYHRACYCVSIHNYIGENVAKLDQDQIQAARSGSSEDSKTQKILSLTDSILEKKGLLSTEELESAKHVGLTDAEIIEIVANVSWNIFANYIDGVAEPKPDVPQVELLE